MIRTLLLSLCCAFSLSAHNKPSQYKIASFATTIEQCESLRLSTVQKFIEISAANVVASSCNKNPTKAFDLEIAYIPTSDRPLVSTYVESARVHGLYPSQSSCSQAIDQETSDFIANTGLTPVVAFCFRDPSQQSSDRSWTLRIDSFGKPLKRPQSLALHVFGTTSVDVVASSRHLTEHLSNLGASAPRVSFVVQPKDTFILLKYYNEAALPLKRFDLGSTPSHAECQQAEDQFLQMIRRADGDTTLFLCLSRSGTTELDMLALATTHQPLAYQNPGLEYSSLATCKAAQTSVEDAWRRDHNRNVIGSMCAIETFIDTTTAYMQIFWLE